MIPILYAKEETSFTTNGIGRLSDSVACVVSERLNDFYTLEMTYSADGKYANEIQTGRLILATPSDGEAPQPFRIYEVTKMLGGTIEVLANHISYDLSGIPARNITGITSASGAIAALKSREWFDSGFSYSTDLSVNKDWEKLGAFSVRSCMGGEGSILETYGGEWYYDRYTCQLLEHRGADNGVSIRYGKNLTELEATSNDDESYTGVFTYYLSNGTYVSCTDIAYLDSLAVPQKILIIDHTSDFQSTPTKAQLDALASADLAQIIGVTSSLTVSFAPLWQSEEYRDLLPIERVKLGDFVTVIYDKYNISTKLEVVQTDYNVLLDRYDSIELGAIRPTLADTIANLSK